MRPDPHGGPGFVLAIFEINRSRQKILALEAAFISHFILNRALHLHPRIAKKLQRLPQTALRAIHIARIHNLVKVPVVMNILLKSVIG